MSENALFTLKRKTQLLKSMFFHDNNRKFQLNDV